jgi:hypothetical protein
MTERPDFTRLPPDVPVEEILAIELEDDDRWAGLGGGGGDLATAEGDGD